jgi:hypothetical protein
VRVSRREQARHRDVAIGSHDVAVRIDAAVVLGDGLPVQRIMGPLFRDFRADPRFERIRRRLGTERPQHQ